MEKVPMTPAGFQSMEAELKQLKNVDRRDVIEAIAEARAHGDLSENAEYHAAREKQGFIEGRIKELESKISRAEVIDIKNFVGHQDVKFGATVTLADEETDEEVTYQIVGLDEADLKARRISITSPVARALIGKEVGDSCEVMRPGGGPRSYEIINVQYI